MTSTAAAELAQTVRASRGRAILLLASALLGGCVAQVKQERVYAAGGAETGDTSWTDEKRPSPESPEQTECRRVGLTSPMLREVETRRSFSNPQAQENNAAFIMLLATGMAFLSYAANQSHCPGGVGCKRWEAAEYGALGVTAIPIGFAAYNAFRVQDRREVELTPPERREEPWHVCSGDRATGADASSAR